MSIKTLSNNSKDRVMFLSLLACFLFIALVFGAMTGHLVTSRERIAVGFVLLLALVMVYAAINARRSARIK